MVQFLYTKVSIFLHEMACMNAIAHAKFFLLLLLTLFAVSFPSMVFAGPVPDGGVCTVNTNCQNYPVSGCWYRGGGPPNIFYCGQPLTASCSVAPTTIKAGQSATWAAQKQGGFGSYTTVYSWTDNSGPGGAFVDIGSTANVTKTYNTGGTFTGKVAVNFGPSQQVSCQVSPNLTVTKLPNGDSCTLDSQCQSGNCKNGNICAAQAMGSLTASKTAGGTYSTSLIIDNIEDERAFLAWDFQNVNGGSCNLSKDGVLSGSPGRDPKKSGVNTGTLNKDTTFEMACTWGSAGTSISQSIEIRVMNRNNNLPCDNNNQCNSTYCDLSAGICKIKPQAPSFTFVGATIPVTYNGNITLTWSSVTNATECHATGDWSGDKAIAGGSDTLGPLISPKTYTLTCTGPAGGSTSHSVTASVTSPACTGYNVTAWGPCSASGSQTAKTYTYIPAGCRGSPTTPIPTQTCTPPSIQCSWAYSSYGSCDPTTSTQTRTATKTPAGCNVDPVAAAVTSKPCTPTCNISYSPWSSCTGTGGNRTRTETSRTPAGCSATAVLEEACIGGYDTVGGTPGHITDPLGGLTITQFVEKALKAFVDLLIPIIVIFYLITGLMFITARGNPEKLKVAKTALLYVTIGAAVVLGAWVLAQMIDATVKAVTQP